MSARDRCDNCPKRRNVIIHIGGGRIAHLCFACARKVRS
jgi:hypothetical protein